MSQQVGVVTATVTDVHDETGQGRIRVRYPWLPGNNEGYWAPVATLMAGGGRGAWFRPEKNDEVLVAFAQGDVKHPYIVGFLWNGEQKPPETDPNLRKIHSVNGHTISIYDPPISQGDTGYIQIKDAHGNMIELANGKISITSTSVVDIKAPQVYINGRPVVVSPKPI